MKNFRGIFKEGDDITLYLKSDPKNTLSGKVKSMDFSGEWIFIEQKEPEYIRARQYFIEAEEVFLISMEPSI